MRWFHVEQLGEQPIFTFETKFNGAFTFAFNILGSPLADLNDGNGFVPATTIVGNLHRWTITYVNANVKQIRIKVASFDDVVSLGPTNEFTSKHIIRFDASKLRLAGGRWDFNFNSELVEFLCPAPHDNTTSGLNFQNCTSLQSFDASDVKYSNSSLNFSGCTSLQTFVGPTYPIISAITPIVSCNFSNTIISDVNFLSMFRNGSVTIGNTTSLVGQLNLENFERLVGIIISGSSNITGVKFHPVNVSVLGLWTLWAQTVNSLASIDFSKNTINANSRIWISSNSLTSFIFPVVLSPRLVDFMVDGGNLGTLTVPSTVRASRFSFSNMGLTEVNFPASNIKLGIGEMAFGNNSITALNNLSFQTGLNLQLSGNVFRFENNGASAAVMNKIVFDLNSILTAKVASPFIRIQGNSAFDTTSGGHNGIAARDALIAKNYTFA